VGDSARASQNLADFTLLLRHFRHRFCPTARWTTAPHPSWRTSVATLKTERSIQESLRSYLRRLSEGGAVQEELVTIRGERFVIPVKIEQRRRVQVWPTSLVQRTDGLHRALETIEQNNDLVRCWKTSKPKSIAFSST